jgi:dynein heavy chain
LRKDFPELPSGDLYELGLNKELHEFAPWSASIPTFKYDPTASFFSILVPTADTVKYKYLLNTLLGAGQNALLTGETGVGKSVITKDWLAFAPEDMVSACVNFSGKTSANNL